MSRSPRNLGGGPTDASAGCDCDLLSGRVRNLLQYFVKGHDLAKHPVDDLQCGLLIFRRLFLRSSPAGCGGIAEKQNAEVTRVGLACGGVAADRRRDPGNDDRVDAALAKNQFKTGSVEAAESRLLEEDVARLDLQVIVEGRCSGALVEESLVFGGRHEFCEHTDIRTVWSE